MAFSFSDISKNVIESVEIKWLYKTDECAFKFEVFECIKDSIILNQGAKSLRMIMRKTAPHKAILPPGFNSKDYERIKGNVSRFEVFNFLIREKSEGFVCISDTWDDATAEYDIWPMVHEDEILFYCNDDGECVYVHVFLK